MRGTVFMFYYKQISQLEPSLLLVAQPVVVSANLFEHEKTFVKLCENLKKKLFLILTCKIMNRIEVLNSGIKQP